MREIRWRTRVVGAFPDGQRLDARGGAAASHRRHEALPRHGTITRTRGERIIDRSHMTPAIGRRCSLRSGNNGSPTPVLPKNNCAQLDGRYRLDLGQDCGELNAAPRFSTWRSGPISATSDWFTLRTIADVSISRRHPREIEVVIAGKFRLPRKILLLGISRVPLGQPKTGDRHRPETPELALWR